MSRELPADVSVELDASELVVDASSARFVGSLPGRAPLWPSRMMASDRHPVRPVRRRP